MGKKKSGENGNGNASPALIADVPIQFGGVSIGESTARLSMKVRRSALGLYKADELFCERRLTGKMQLGGDDDQPAQGKLFEANLTIEASFDIHRFGVTTEAYTTGATVKLNEVDIADLAKFSKGTGRFLIFGADAIPDEADSDEKEDSGATLPGTLTQDGAWREVSLDTLFMGALLKSLKGAGLATVGDLHDYQQPGKNGFEKRLTDIEGIGPSKVQLIEDRMLEFWRDNPQEEKKVLEGVG